MYISATPPYSPQGIRNFIGQLDHRPSLLEIATYRIQQRLGVRDILDDPIDSPYVLHATYIQDKHDRKVAFEEIWRDIQDAVCPNVI